MIPKFETPATFKNENDYLRHLTYKGAERHYKNLTDEIRNRIDFELETIQAKSLAGYFLMVQEITQAAREMDILIGPGRSTAVGSIVNYCLGITGVDPLKFDLLFEPFLNPDQITLPYFSFDFDEDGREKILPWLIEKYGKEKIAQLATFEPNKKLHINFCAVVIGADDLDKFIPIASIKPSWYSGEAMIFTSCDKSTIKEMGLVKLDLLGLTALSTIKGTLSDIQKTKGIEIDISKIPLDDAKTFELFKKGNTEDIFQFHSVGMQTDLLALQPDKFENLIALLVSSKGAANKSHAAAYTLIGYQMAYLKANFREEFEENVSLYKL